MTLTRQLIIPNEGKILVEQQWSKISMRNTISKLPRTLISMEWSVTDMLIISVLLMDQDTL